MLIVERLSESHHLRTVLRLSKVNPDILLCICRWSQAEKRNGTQPRRLDEWPDEEAIKVVILPSALSFGCTQLDELRCSRSVTGDLENVVFLEPIERLLQVGGQAFRWENEFTAEELYLVSARSSPEPTISIILVREK